jgi:Questin oxidase-like
VEFQARYGGELADHLPMARMALRRMGAPPSRIEAFACHYIEGKKLQPLADAPCEANARDTIREEIQRDGRDPVVRRRLAELMPGVGAGAFHPLIRLAYAIEGEDDREVAAALVYWQDAFLDLGFARVDVPAPFLPEVAFERLRRDVATAELPKGIIFIRMSAAAAGPAFAVAVRAGGFPRDEGDVQSIARFVVTWFAATRGFVALHAMTAVHALRIVMPYLDPSQALPAIWWALCAAYVAAGSPEIGDPGMPALPSWESVLAAAVASDDEHDIKAAYTASNEERVYGGELYRLAAARYLRLVL